ncbi:MAG: cobalamin B12-binding domain-containing protein, partial [Candidatus Omnitrophota bacterium]
MKVVLLSLFHYDNFGIRLLFSYLRANNIPVFCVNFKRMKQKVTKTLKNDYVEMHDYHTEVKEEDINTLLDQLNKLDPALIGIGLQSTHFQIAKRITKAIKDRFKIPVIWGGSHPTIDPENCIK